MHGEPDFYNDPPEPDEDGFINGEPPIDEGEPDEQADEVDDDEEDDLSNGRTVTPGRYIDPGIKWIMSYLDHAGRERIVFHMKDGGRREMWATSLDTKRIKWLVNSDSSFRRVHELLASEFDRGFVAGMKYERTRKDTP